MKKDTLFPSAQLVDAVSVIERNRRRIAIVVDEDGRLLGTLTDGDIRRCLLSGGALDTPVSVAMNSKPLSAPVGSPDSYLLDIMKRGNILALPLVDEAGGFVKVLHLWDIRAAEGECEKANFAFAVIMAGGEGLRLRPITDNIPKPMVDIGGVPLLERQIQRLADARIKRVYISVNYLSHLIEEYFGDGSSFGVEIRYLREVQKLGTCGALSLLLERPDEPILVMNGDILTTSDFRSLSEFHRNNNAELTVAAVEYNVNIPFGVIQNEGIAIQALVEKPSQRFFCNAGIYVVSPAALDHIPREQYFNMTDLVASCLAVQKSVVAFPVHEYWNDIGTHMDLEKARNYYSEQA